MTTEEKTATTPKKTRKSAKAHVDPEKVGEWEAAAAEAAEVVADARQEAMPPRRFEGLLPCKLTDEEHAERGQQLSAALAVVDTITAERKQANDGFKARAELAMERVRELREVVDSGEEERNVEQIERFDIRRQSAQTIRTDTGEMVSERAMRQSELQPDLPISNGANGHAEQMNLGDVEPTDIVDAESMLADAIEPKGEPLSIADESGDEDQDGEDEEGDS